MAFEFANRVYKSKYSFPNEIAFLKQSLKTSNLAEILPSSFAKFNQDDEDESKKFIAILEANQKGLTIHDNRIYSLIHKTRKYMRLKSSITNAYGGGYWIHEDWIKKGNSVKTSGVSG